MQEDTYLGNGADPLSLNLYTYCVNNPLIYWDPTGHAAATPTTIYDSKGNASTGYIINGTTYKDAAGTQRIDNGTTVKTGDGYYQLQNGVGVKVSGPPASSSSSSSSSNKTSSSSSSSSSTGTAVKVTLANGNETTGYIVNGITKMADGSDVPIGSVVETKNGDYMKTQSGGVAVTPTTVVLKNGAVTTGYISKADNLTYMLGGTRPEVGSAVVTANGTYKMTTSRGALLPSTLNGTLSKGSSGDAVLVLQVQLNVKSNAGLVLDGKFGSITQAAVIAYQATNGLATDGRVGPLTSAALGFGYVAPTTKSTSTIVGTAQSSEEMTYAYAHMAALAFKELYFEKSQNERQEYFAFIDEKTNGRFVLSMVTTSAECLGKNVDDLTYAERKMVTFINDGSHTAKIHTHWDPNGNLSFSYYDYVPSSSGYMPMYLVNGNGEVLYCNTYKPEDLFEGDPGGYTAPVYISGMYDTDTFNRHK
jgi:peptidoglycan hydrolase-like protein with peptidoglycan-binding domain